MIDFKRIAKESKLYNFHSHSPYCDGHAPIEDFIKEAIKMGFTHYGVSPHSPIPFFSPCNMAKEKVGDYLAEMNMVSKSVFLPLWKLTTLTIGDRQSHISKICLSTIASVLFISFHRL